MAFCVEPARRCARFPFFVSLIVLAQTAHSFDFHDALHAEKLPDGLSAHIAKESKGSIAPSADGVILGSESNRHAILKFESPVPGTDEHPLLVSARIRTSANIDGNMLPGIYLYWNDKNCVSMRATFDTHVYFGWTRDGEDALAYEHNVMRESRLAADPKFNGKEVYFRIFLAARNVAFYVSHDGANWRKLGESGCRPGAPGAIPKILFGRGFAGEKPELCNDSSKDPRPPIKTYISEVNIADHGAPTQPDAPEIDKKETWEQTLAALEPAGIPHAWSVLAPAGEKVLHDAKDWLAIDNWATAKDVGGKPVKFFNWNKPDDEADDPLVDLHERIEHAKGAIVLCRTDIEWLVGGEALLWYDCVEPCKIWVNNKLAYDYLGNEWWRERHPVKDRSAIPVSFEKGKNSVKILIHAMRGDVSYYFRAERSDTPRRIGQIEKMLGYFPPPAGGWRAAEAMFEIARAYEEAFDFKNALASYSAAGAALKSDDESLVRAFEGKLRIYAFLRDFDNAAKTADAYLAEHPADTGSASAMRAALRFETLAGRAGQARERAHKWSAQHGPGAPLCGAESLRIVAGALAEAGARVEHLATLEEIAASKDLKAEERARAAIESACWRCEYERRKALRAVPPDPAELERACRSMLAAVEMLPSAKNPAVHQFVLDAETELKNKKPDRAYGAGWGAALMALLASDPDTAYYFAPTKAYPIELPLKDKNKVDIADQNVFKDLAWNMLREKCGDPVWAGKWRIVAFKRSRDGKPNPDINGPQTNAEPGARYGDRGWTEIDPEADKTERAEFGFDVKRFSGDGQVAYLAREFDMPAAADTILQLSNSGAWSGWMDGKPVGRDLSADAYKIEADRIPLHLEKGRHRVLIRLEPPAEGVMLFRARIGAEPQLAMLLYVQALAARQFPVSMNDRTNELNVLREALTRRTTPETLVAYAQSVSQMYDDQKWFAVEQMIYAAQILRESNRDALAMKALREALTRLEDGPAFQGRSQKILEVARALARALVYEGETAAADAILAHAVNRHPSPASDAALCLAWRGTLRWELGMSQAALPFFERCARESRLPDEARQLSGPGLEWARFTRPERVSFESSHEVQALLDAVRRQLSGAPDDIEKAMRGLGEILRSTNNSMVKVSETPFAVRYVGVREYIRSMLESMTAEQRGVYRKVVGEAAAQRLQRVAEHDPAELEKAALEFPFTRESQNALNRAGDLYFDRGRYGQAASIYSTLLREPNQAESATLACAKLALADAFDGEKADCEAALKRLESEFAKTSVKIKGAAVTGVELAARLRKQIAGMGAVAAGGDAGAFPYMGGLTRTGAMHGPAPEPGGVAWAQPCIASGALDGAKSSFGIDSRSHIQSVPVTDGTRVFVGAMESLRAFDLNSGDILWTQTWAGGLSGAASAGFNGFPSSCPLLNGDKVIIRAQSLASSLKCFDAATGALRWSSDAQPELKKIVWISDPAAAYGMIFALYVEPGDFSIHGVAALDAETGRLRWRTPLASGATGIKVGIGYFQAANHMGPPAIDAGELYVETGLASVAAINAFTGEARWISSYPRIQLGDLKRGNTGAFDLTVRSFKAFSRGPLSPILLGNRVVASPHDANGVLAFDRRDGSILWHRELLDCRYVAGVADGRILACDNSVTALDSATGATVWRTDLEGQSLQGSPTLSGGMLYMPMRDGLLRVDALKGTVVGSTAWDARTGPVANLLVTPNRIVGVSEHAVVTLGTGSAGASALPFYEAKRLEAEGKLEEAVQRYAAAQAADKDGLPMALTARVRLLKRLDKRAEALQEVAKFEHDAPPKLSAMGGLWTTGRDAVAHSLRRSLGENPPDPNAGKTDPVDGLACVLAYSMFLPGDNPQVAHFQNDPPNRVFMRLNGDVKCMSLGENPETLWSAYVGTQVKILASGDNYLAAVSDREIAVLDRETGETLSQIIIANTEAAGAGAGGAARIRAAAFRRRSAVQGESFVQAIVLNGVIYAATESRLGAWDAATGKRLWERALLDSRFIENGLSGHDAVIQRVYLQREDVMITSFDAATGTEIQTLPAEPQQRIAFSPDHHYMVARRANRLTCVDLFKMAILWRKDSDDLDIVSATLEFTPNGQIRYAGADKRNGNKQTVRHFDLATGNDAVPAVVDGEGVQSSRGLFVVTERGYKISRLKPAANGGAETVWTTRLPVQRGVDFAFTHAFTAGSFFHSVYLRNADTGVRDQLFLRTLAWETGQNISEQALPGTALTTINPYTGGKTVTSTFVLAGGTLVYTAKEGIFLFRPQAATPAQSLEKLRTELRNPATPAERLKQLRRSVAGLDQPEAMAFVTPAGARVGGDLSEWAGTEPIVLADRSDYVPLNEGAVWAGAGEFSAKIYAGWNQAGVMFAIDVTDSTPESPRPGSELTTGDRVRIVIDSRDGENSALDPNESFVCTLALSQGRSFFAQEFGIVPENAPFAEGKVAPSVSGKGRQYELFVPWSALRKSPTERPGERRELRLGVAIYDGDATHTRGALEWGAGTTVSSAMPLWLGRLSLIDVSAEKVERYRKVIAMVPGSPEALKFMRLILLSKRGPAAEAERIGELEKFIVEHPDSANTPKAAGMLREAYKRTADPDPARLEKLLQRAKVPETVRLALDAAFKMWVYPDPKKPPQMIMVQFSNGDFNWGVVRAYWGAPVLPLGRDGSVQMKKMGDLPKPGVWTELRVSPLDMDLENIEIKVFALTSAGGLTYFDRVAYSVAGKETVLIEGKLPDKCQTQLSPIGFVDQPKRAAAKSMAFGAFHQVEGLYDTHFNSSDWQPMMNFAALRPVDSGIKNPAQYQDVCRRAARIIDDTPEGLAFLRRAIDLNEGDEKQKSAKAIVEIKEFLKQGNGSQNAYEALKLAFEYFTRSGDPKPMAKMDEFIGDVKPPIAATRAFYADRSPGWTEWRVLGPYVATGERRGMESSMEPERAVDLTLKTQNSGRDLEWKKISSKAKNGDTVVDMRLHLGAEKESYRGPYFGYAYTKFNCPTKRKALFAFGADDVISIWVNGRRVVNEVYTSALKDKELFEVQLRSGENEILIKAGVQSGRLAFIFRMADLDGKPFDDIQNE